MGYQIGVTPLQMATAVSAVANGGETDRAARDSGGLYRDSRRFAVQPKVVRRAIKRRHGGHADGDHGRRRGRRSRDRGAARMPGYTIAGKTGTAATLENGRYSHTDYNASFVGFVPSRDPAVVIIVVINSPHAGRPPVARCPRRSSSASPRRRFATSEWPRRSTRLRRFSWHATATASTSRRVACPRRIPVVSFVADGPPGTVPDLRGMSAREALRTLVKLGMNGRVSGDGFVASQEPQPGSPIEDDGLCRLVLERWPVAAGRERGTSMTWAELHGTLRGRGLIRADDALRAEAAVGVVTGISYDSRAVGARRSLRRAEGPAPRRDRVPRQAIERGAAADRLRAGGACRHSHPLGHRRGRAARDGGAGCGVLSRSKPRDARDRHHRHQRKTTTAYLVASIFEAAGVVCGVLGTVEYRIGAEVREATRTTPEAPDLQALLREMVDRRCGACAMEVSSPRLVTQARRRHHVSPPASSPT